MASSCPDCDGNTITRPVPDAIRGILSDDPAIINFCERCLAVHPAPGESVDIEWVPGDTSSALPNDSAAAIALGMLITLLASIALHRREIEEVVTYLEEETGSDPLLALDRLTTTPLLEPQIDIPRRRHQLAQMLSR